jgi:Ca-activated chloride channel family protein
MIDIEFLPERNGICADTDNSFEVLVRLSARASGTDHPVRERAPLNLALVIDRSGSMQGRPLEEAKRCAERMVDRLGSRDRVAIVAYDDKVDVVVPSQPVTDPARIKAGIRSIQVAGMTALYDGWHVGATQVAETMKRTDMARVLLLSDGCANKGLSDPDTIAQHCATLADNGISTSTYGLGTNFREDLMTAMAQAGQGRAHYGQTAEDLMDPFEEEFDLLDAIVARRLRLSLHATPGVRLKSLNGYRLDDTGAIILPDLPRDGDVWLLLSVEVPAHRAAGDGGGAVNLLAASLHYQDIEGRPAQVASEFFSLNPVAAPFHAQLAVNELVRNRSIELRAARLQDEARAAARRGDWGRVEAIIAEIRAFAGDHGWVLASLEALQVYAKAREVESFAKEATYKSDRMRSRVMARYEGARGYAAADEATAPRYLRRKAEEGKRFDQG